MQNKIKNSKHNKTQQNTTHNNPQNTTKHKTKQAGVELGLTQADTISLEISLIKGLTKLC